MTNKMANAKDAEQAYLRDYKILVTIVEFSLQETPLFSKQDQVSLFTILYRRLYQAAFYIAPLWLSCPSSNLINELHDGFCPVHQ